jgi:hypothetical protein
MKESPTGARLTAAFGSLPILVTLWIPVADARHFKVYGAATLDTGEMELVYWADYIAQSSKAMEFFGETVDREKLWTHSLEVEYGAMDRATIAMHVDLEQPAGKDLEYIQTRIEGRYRLSEPDARAFDSTLYLEYYLPDPRYQGAKEAIEARLIFERDIGATNLRINPKIEKKISGPDVEEGIEFEYGLSLYRPFTVGAKMGLEFYGAIGELVNTKPIDQQQHYIVPAFTFDLIDHLSWNVGVAIGITKASDDTTIKSILEWEI